MLFMDGKHTINLVHINLYNTEQLDVANNLKIF